jgi:hypothetical protein
LRDLAIFRLIDDASSIESSGDKTGKIDVFAVKKDPARWPGRLDYGADEPPNSR